MTPTEADSTIAAIRARLPKIQWPPEVWADFKAEMIRVRIDDEQGLACVRRVILDAKYAPAPAHFLEAFKSAQGEKHQTCSPATPESGYRGEFWHPRGWAIVRGWTWMRAEENWPKLPELLAEFARESGWLPHWEAIIVASPPGPFSNEEIQELGLWVNARTRKANPRGSFDLWESKQREDQERKVMVIAALREKVRKGTVTHG